MSFSIERYKEESKRLATTGVAWEDVTRYPLAKRGLFSLHYDGHREPRPPVPLAPPCDQGLHGPDPHPRPRLLELRGALARREPGQAAEPVRHPVRHPGPHRSGPCEPRRPEQPQHPDHDGRLMAVERFLGD